MGCSRRTAAARSTARARPPGMRPRLSESPGRRAAPCGSAAGLRRVRPGDAPAEPGRAHSAARVHYPQHNRPGPLRALRGVRRQGGALVAPPAVRRAWSTGARRDVTFSLPCAVETLRAAEAAVAVADAESVGWTMRRGLGGWRGAVETSYTLTLIGRTALVTRRIVAALIAAGCTCVQVETWDADSGPSYVCEEWCADA